MIPSVGVVSDRRVVLECLEHLRSNYMSVSMLWRGSVGGQLIELTIAEEKKSFRAREARSFMFAAPRPCTLNRLQ